MALLGREEQGLGENLPAPMELKMYSGELACPKRTVTYCYRKETVFDRMDLASGPMPPPREKTNLFPTILFPPGKVKLLFQTGLQEPESLV